MLLQRQPTRHPPAWLAWLADHLVPVLTLLGALLYGFARWSYVAYYGTFGLEPEDVGVSYSAVLAEGVLGLLVGVVLPVLLLAVLVVAAIIGIARLVRVRAEKRSMGAALVALGGYGPILLLVALLFVLPSWARRQASNVKRGEEVHASGSLVSAATFRNPLALNARRIEAQWIEQEADRPIDLGTHLMLVGSGSDVHYLWDVERRRTVRLPRNLVIIYESDP